MGRVLLSDALGPVFGEGTALHCTLAELVCLFLDRPQGRGVLETGLELGVLRPRLSIPFSREQEMRPCLPFTCPEDTPGKGHCLDYFQGSCPTCWGSPIPVLKSQGEFSMFCCAHG